MISTRIWHRFVFLLGCLFAVTGHAQIFTNPDSTWREGRVPEPQALSTNNMVQIAMPDFSSLLVGVDINNIVVSPQDGVVRYVVLLQGPEGALFAYYQGIRCETLSTRTYARYRFDKNPPAWESVDADWEDFPRNRLHYIRAIAQAGACENLAPVADTKTARRKYAKLNRWSGKQIAPDYRVLFP